jgi:hypothetical protein
VLILVLLNYEAIINKIFGAAPQSEQPQQELELEPWIYLCAENSKSDNESLFSHLYKQHKSLKDLSPEQINVCARL